MIFASLLFKRSDLQSYIHIILHKWYGEMSLLAHEDVGHDKIENLQLRRYEEVQQLRTYRPNIEFLVREDILLKQTTREQTQAFF